MAGDGSSTLDLDNRRSARRLRVAPLLSSFSAWRAAGGARLSPRYRIGAARGSSRFAGTCRDRRRAGRFVQPDADEPAAGLSPQQRASGRRRLEFTPKAMPIPALSRCRGVRSLAHRTQSDFTCSPDGVALSNRSSSAHVGWRWLPAARTAGRAASCTGGRPPPSCHTTGG